MQFWSSEDEGDGDVAAWLASQSEPTGAEVVDFPGAVSE
jgi:hypothetical protein